MNSAADPPMGGSERKCRAPFRPKTKNTSPRRMRAAVAGMAGNGKISYNKYIIRR